MNTSNVMKQIRQWARSHSCAAVVAVVVASMILGAGTMAAMTQDDNLTKEQREKIEQKRREIELQKQEFERQKQEYDKKVSIAKKEVNEEIARQRAEIKKQVAAQQAEIKAQQAEIKKQVAAQQAEIKKQQAETKREVARQRAEIKKQVQQQRTEMKKQRKRLASQKSAARKKSRSNVVMEKVQVSASNFSKLEMSTVMNVVMVVQPNPGYAVVEADAETLPYIQLNFNKGKLNISYTREMNNIPATPTVYLYNDKLDDIDLSGVASFKVKGELNTNTMDIDMAGVCDLDIPSVKCKKMDIEASGVTKLNIGSVETDLLDVETSGCASVNLKSIYAKTVKADASGTSDIKVAGRCNSIKKTVSSVATVNHSGLIVEQTPKKNTTGGTRKRGMPQEP